jgi:hypothetical protein
MCGMNECYMLDAAGFLFFWAFTLSSGESFGMNAEYCLDRVEGKLWYMKPEHLLSNKHFFFKVQNMHPAHLKSMTA